MSVTMTAVFMIQALLLSGCSGKDNGSDSDDPGASEAEVEETAETSDMTAIVIEPDATLVETEEADPLSSNGTVVINTSDLPEIEVDGIPVEYVSADSDPDFTLISALSSSDGLHSVSEEEIGTADYYTSRTTCSSRFVTNEGYMFIQEDIQNYAGDRQLAVIDTADGSVAGYLDLPRFAREGDYFIFEKDHIVYLEIDTMDQDYNLRSIDYYEVDLQTMSIGDPAEPFGGADLCITSGCEMPDGVCFAVAGTDDTHTDDYLYFYIDGKDDPDIVDLNSLFDTSDMYINYLTYYAEGTMAVKAYTYYDQQKSALINYGDKAAADGRISEAFPTELREANSAITDSNGVPYFFSDNGVISYDAGSDSYNLVFANCDVDMNASEITMSQPLCINDNGSITYIYSNYEYNYRGPVYVSRTVPFEADIADDRQTVNVLVSGYIDEYIANMIDTFNENNSQYRARACSIYPPTWFISFTDPVPADSNTEYSFEINTCDQYESARISNTYIQSVLEGGYGVDVFLTYGAQPEYIRAGLFEDLDLLMQEYETDHPGELFYNVIDASRLDGGLYQIPLQFYMSGIISEQELTGNLFSGGISGGAFDILSTDHAGYVALVSDHLGNDPITAYYTDSEYINELISAEYQDVVNGGTGEPDTGLIENIVGHVDEMDSSYNTIFIDNSCYTPIMSIDDLLWNSNTTVDQMRSFICLPSMTGESNGVTAGPLLSEAVMADAPNSAGACDFIRASLGTDAQGGSLYSGTLLVNRAAMDLMAEKYTEFYEDLQQLQRAYEIVTRLADSVTDYFYIDVELRSSVENALHDHYAASPDEVAQYIADSYTS